MAELLKNIYFQKKFFDQLTQKIHEQYPQFDTPNFFKLLYDRQWEARELKERMRHTSICLSKTLPLNFPEVCKVLRKVAPYFKELDAMVFPDYIEVFGLEYFELSLDMLGFLTRFSSSEFAIRPFIQKYPQKTLTQMSAWADDENHHVRRFASEGCRPRLPWAMALPMLKKDPSPILPILEKLKADSSEYVRKSVANNINDISKDHPKIVIETAQKWSGYSAYTDWIIKHGCRTLLKQGNSEALSIFGFGDIQAMHLTELSLSSEELCIGDELMFSFHLKTHQATKLRLEYKIDYVKAKGKISSKIFQISEKSYEKDEKKTIQKAISLKNLSTRKHYPGRHRLAIIANGQEVLSHFFQLKTPD